GSASATIRDIAKAAGVSGGLVRHHFGSKDGLREACDAYALDRLMRIKEQAVVEGQLASPAFLAGAHPTILLLYRYLVRSMVDGSPSVAGMFDEMVKLGEHWLDRHLPGQFEDPWAYSAMQIGRASCRERVEVSGCGGW